MMMILLFVEQQYDYSDSKQGLRKECLKDPIIKQGHSSMKAGFDPIIGASVTNTFYILINE